MWSGAETGPGGGGGGKGEGGRGRTSLGYQKQLQAYEANCFMLEH